ncbi:MAG: hypothetical protein AAF533_25760 [Acidobacteriota bacterium]
MANGKQFPAAGDSMVMTINLGGNAGHPGSWVHGAKETKWPDGGGTTMTWSSNTEYARFKQTLTENKLVSASANDTFSLNLGTCELDANKHPKTAEQKTALANAHGANHWTGSVTRTSWAAASTPNPNPKWWSGKLTSGANDPLVYVTFTKPTTTSLAISWYAKSASRSGNVLKLATGVSSWTFTCQASAPTLTGYSQTTWTLS